MAERLILISHWEQNFETYESLRLKGPGTWVAIPTKHDGRSYRRLIMERDGAALYGAWITMVQVAKKMPVRGVLADSSGPLSAEDLQDKTMVPSKTFERMLDLVSQDRIGWVQILTEPAAIAAHLRAVAAECTPRPRAGRERPQTPAEPRENGHSPADSGHSPALPAASRTTAGVPADSRSSPQAAADERTSRARAGGQDRTGQDRTGQDRTIPPTVHQPPGVSALEDTVHFLCGLFGRKRTRLGQNAEHQLAHWADHLPLSLDQKQLLTWFYRLPGDQENIDLRSRHGDADKLALNLFAALERAEAYKKKVGQDYVEKGRAAVPAPAPEGGWEWYAEAYPDAPRPPTWSGLPDSVRSEFQLRKKP